MQTVILNTNGGGLWSDSAKAVRIVDMVLDKDHGPLILELNARPGLAIQIANGVGLLPRLQQIEALGDVKMSVEDRVAYSIQHFGMRKVVAEVAVGQDVAVAP